MEQPGKRIRKIQWGLIQTLPTKIIALGSSVRFKEPKGSVVEYFVTEITEDHNAFFDTGSCQFNVYVSKTKDSNENTLWQRLSLRPELIEYIFDDVEEFIV